MSNLFRDILATRIEHLWKLFEASGQLGHPGEKGSLRELFLRRVFESVLPHHFGVGSGVIVDRWGKQSAQTDLLIYDRRRLPPVLEENGHGIYPFDAVLRIIEVKSTLDQAALSQFKNAAWQLSPTNPNGLKMATIGNLDQGQSYYPLATLFAYQSSIKDVPAAVKRAGGMLDNVAVFCVATRGLYVGSDGWESVVQDKTACTQQFLTLFLDQIEATADSRKSFSLVEWLR